MTTLAQSNQSIGEDSLKQSKAKNYLLWVLQVLLMCEFLFAGGVKLVMPIEAMSKQIQLPGPFLRFLGVAEVLGAIGLVLPWLLGIQRRLTVVAACCLVIIMVGAVVLTLKTGGGAMALFPFVVGILLLIVARGRGREAFAGKSAVGIQPR